MQSFDFVASVRQAKAAFIALAFAPSKWNTISLLLIIEIRKNMEMRCWKSKFTLADDLIALLIVLRQRLIHVKCCASSSCFVYITRVGSLLFWPLYKQKQVGREYNGEMTIHHVPYFSRGSHWWRKDDCQRSWWLKNYKGRKSRLFCLRLFNWSIVAGLLQLVELAADQLRRYTTLKKTSDVENNAV